MMDELKLQILNKISELVIQGNYKLMTDEINNALNSEILPKEILDYGLLKGMDVVGAKFRDGIIFLPEVLMSARAFKTAMSVIEPLLMQNPSSNQLTGKILLGTVKGDIHDIGKNLVGVMLKGNGFVVIDIGVDASIEKFIDGIEN